MGTFQRDEIMGIFKEERVLCPEHFGEEEMKQDNVITQSDLEDGETIYFCDECGERL